MDIVRRKLIFVILGAKRLVWCSGWVKSGIGLMVTKTHTCPIDPNGYDSSN